MRRILAALTLTAGIATGAVIAPTPASASPTSCRSFTSSSQVGYTCANDLRANLKYRAKAVCNYGAVTVYGPTKTANGYDYGPHSVATCPYGTHVTGKGVSWWF